MGIFVCFIIQWTVILLRSYLQTQNGSLPKSIRNENSGKPFESKMNELETTILLRKKKEREKFSVAVAMTTHRSLIVNAQRKF